MSHSSVPNLQNLSCFSNSTGDARAESLKEMLYSAVTVAAGFQHANIAPVLGITLQEDGFTPDFLIEEYTFNDLRGYLRELDRFMTLKELLQLCGDVLAGLACVHEGGKGVHGHLTPETIVILQAREDCVVFKLRGLGFAELEAAIPGLDAGGDASARSACRSFYSAYFTHDTVLEEAPDSGVRSAADDMFAFGVIIAEVVMGHLHSSRNTPSATTDSGVAFLAARSAMIDDAVTYLSRICPVLSAVVASVTNAHPSKRMTATTALSRLSAVDVSEIETAALALITPPRTPATVKPGTALSWRSVSTADTSSREGRRFRRQDIIRALQAAGLHAVENAVAERLIAIRWVSAVPEDVVVQLLRDSGLTAMNILAVQDVLLGNSPTHSNNSGSGGPGSSHGLSVTITSPTASSNSNHHSGVPRHSPLAPSVCLYYY